MTSESVNRGENPIDPEAVKRLADEGWGRNSIARQLRVSTYRVDQAADAAGVTFDRARTRAAVDARVSEAALEREQLAGDFRQITRVILAKVLGSDPGDLDPATLRDLLWSAGSAAASDARYGRLSLDRQIHAQAIDQNSEAKENFAELLNTIRGGFATLDEEDEEELQRQVDQADAEYFDAQDQDDD